MTDKPENFVVTFKPKHPIVERYFDLPNGGNLSYKQVLGPFENDSDPSMLELHRISADMTIRYLLQFLPEGYDAEHPYKAGAKFTS